MTSLKKLFTAPTFDDEIKSQQAYMLYIILWTLVCVPIAFFFYTLFLNPENLRRTILQASFAESVNIFLLFLLYRGYVRAASIFQISAFWLFFTFTAFTGGGVHGESYLLGYGLVIGVAGILLGGTGASVFTILSLIAGGLMVYTQTLGTVYSSYPSTSLTTWVVSLLLFPVGALLQHLSSRTTRIALSRAQASEEKYRLISQVSSDYIFATEVYKDGSADLSWVAGAFEKMTGYTYEEYVANGSWSGHVHPDDAEKDAHDMEKLLNNQDIKSEIRTFTKNGEIRWEQIFAHPVWNEKENRLSGIFGAVRDITEQKQAEAALAHERDLLQIFMDNIPDLIYFKDTESRFLRINQAEARFLGVDNPQDALGKTDLDFQIPEFAQEYMTVEKQIMESGESVISRVEFNPTENKKPRWLSSTKIPVKDSSGRIIGIIGVSRDITDQKQTEAALAYERDILQIFMDNIPDLVYFKDAESRFVRINQAQARFLGIDDPQDALGKTDLDFQNPEIARELLMQEKQIIKTGQPIWDHLEFNPTGDGEPRWLSTTKVPAKNELGLTIGIIGISRNITGQKMAEELEQNRRIMLEKVVRLGQNVTEIHDDLRTTLKRIWHGVHDDLGFDRLGIYLYNPVRNSMDGTFGTNINGDMIDEWHTWVSLERENLEAELFLRVLENPDRTYLTHTYENDFSTPEGHIMSGVKDYAAIAAFAGDKPVAVLCVDHVITGRPISEVQLEALRLFAGYAGLAIENARLNTALQNELSQHKETLLHQSAILNGIPDMAWLKDVEGRYIAVNEQFAARSGMKIEDIIGKTDLDIWQKNYAEKYIEDDIEIMRTRQGKTAEELEIDSAGKEYWVETTKTPILNAQDEVIGTTGVAREINTRKIAELERELLITELEAKNAELERYTYTVSHDLKSPLVTIRGFLGYLEKDALAGNTQKIKEDIKRIENATQKMHALLNDLLELSRIGRLINQSTDILFSDIAKDAINLVHGQIEAKNVLIEIHDTPVIVHGDRTRLTEVIQNLVDNAVKFMGDQPSPQITIGAAENEQNETVFFVSDNGIGIDSQYHERIFTLFSKLNASTEGTGIGLTLIKRIIEVHKGRIWLESEPGKGTTFYFTLNQT
jgi:PAS domain S-box-containing protein